MELTKNTKWFLNKHLKKYSTSLIIQFSSVQLLSCVRPFVTPWITACQASLSITNSQSSLKFTSIESVMPSSISSSVVPFPPTLSLSQHQGLFQWAGSLHQWPQYWSFNFSISPSKEYSGLISFSMDWLDLSRVSLGDWRDSQESSPTPQFKSINSLALSFLYGSTLTLIKTCLVLVWVL